MKGRSRALVLALLVAAVTLCCAGEPAHSTEDSELILEAYIIVTATTPGGLAQKVTDAVANGYYPFGVVVEVEHLGPRLIQPMVRRELWKEMHP